MSTSQFPLPFTGVDTEQETVAILLQEHNEILYDVLRERARQLRKFGPQIRPPFEYTMILVEEVGEVQKEVVETYFSHTPEGEFSEKYRQEMVQVAAVALAAIQSFDIRRSGHEARQKADFQNALNGLQDSQSEDARIAALAPNGNYIAEKPLNNFCQTPGEKCDLGYCDENGCLNRKRPNARHEGATANAAKPNPNHGPNNPHAAQPE